MRNTAQPHNEGITVKDIDETNGNGPLSPNASSGVPLQDASSATDSDSSTVADETTSEELPFSQQEIEDMLGDVESAEAALAEEPEEGKTPTDFPFLLSSDDHNFTATARKKHLGAIIAAVVACCTLVAGLAYGTASGNLSREPELPRATAASLAAEAEQVPAPVTIVDVKAPGYDEAASPIVYHVTGTVSVQENDVDVGEDSTDQEADQTIDFYGTVDASTMQAIDENEAPVDDEFVVVLDSLPAGSYTISWSNSILSDGSHYQVPKAVQFEVAEEDVALEAQFQKVDGAEASAEDVKAAYESIESWLKDATGSVADQRDSILRIARANAENAALVKEAGGLDRVGREDEPESEIEESQDGANWYENASTDSTQGYSPTSDGSTSNNSNNSSNEGQTGTGAGEDTAIVPTTESTGDATAETNNTGYDDTTNYETYHDDGTGAYEFEYYRLQNQETGQN